MSEKDNMKLWDSVCETDPAIAKEVKLGRTFTTVCAQSQIKIATQLWGPMGQAWGVRDERYDVLDSYCIYIATLYYPTGSFPIHADIEIIFSSGQRQGKYNDDFTKKIATDALTKGLSRLGFNSDIFEGKFDDNKYIAEQRAKYAQKDKGTTKPPPATEGKKLPKDAARQKIVDEIGSVLTDKVFNAEDRIKVKAEIHLIKSNIAMEALLATWQSEQNKRIEDFKDDIPGEPPAEGTLFPDEKKEEPVIY